MPVQQYKPLPLTWKRRFEPLDRGLLRRREKGGDGMDLGRIRAVEKGETSRGPLSSPDYFPPPPKNPSPFSLASAGFLQVSAAVSGRPCLRYRYCPAQTAQSPRRSGVGPLRRRPRGALRPHPRCPCLRPSQGHADGLGRRLLISLIFNLKMQS
ncbi:hypothetical protein VTK56DRAFT_4728 [Thermocarpiscus australiensis]